MKRDMELVIKILEFLEERDETSEIPMLGIAGYDQKHVSYHCNRMYEAGLIDAEAITSSESGARLIDVIPFGLTWQGHEFLNLMRNDEISTEIRKKLGGTLDTFPFALINELGLSVGRALLKI